MQQIAAGRVAAEKLAQPSRQKKRRLFRVASLASSDDRLNLSGSPCCRVSLAMSVCFCALAPRGAS
jgi:hypothetical protein